MTNATEDFIEMLDANIIYFDYLKIHHPKKDDHQEEWNTTIEIIKETRTKLKEAHGTK